MSERQLIEIWYIDMTTPSNNLHNIIEYLLFELRATLSKSILWQL